MNDNKQNLTIEEVEHVAKLANLEISEAEVEKFQKQLSSVLEYVQILEEAKTEDVLPTNQITGLENILREDEIDKSLTSEEALLNASQKEGDSFKVKAIFNNES